MSELLQLVGRSSRTAKKHYGSLICKSDCLTKESLINLLNLNNTKALGNSTRTVNVLRGRRLSSIQDDSIIIPLFKNGWIFDFNKLERKLKTKIVLEYEKAALKKI